MLRLRSIAICSMLVASLMLVGVNPRTAAASDADADTSVTLSAFLDGRPIPLADVAKYYCDDFSYPVIQCSVSAVASASRALVMNLLSSVDYVTVYELPGYAGAFMNMTQDYTVLALIGWNDRISSFKARNGQTGTFYVDWFGGGSQWSFCCNTQQPSLGGYDNTFSSVQRT